MSDIPEDVMESARVLNMQLHSATNLGQKTQWIAEAIMEARAKALEEAAKVADTEEELLGDPPQHIIAAMQAVGPVGNARSAVRTTKANIAKRIRALQSEER